MTLRDRAKECAEDFDFPIKGGERFCARQRKYLTAPVGLDEHIYDFARREIQAAKAAVLREQADYIETQGSVWHDGSAVGKIANHLRTKAAKIGGGGK